MTGSDHGQPPVATTWADSATSSQGGDDGDGGDPVGGVLDRLSRTLQQEHLSVEETLQAITRAAAEGMPGARSAGVTLIDRRRGLHNRAATDDLPRQVDAIQVEVGEGPCLQTLRTRHTVRVDDLAFDPRWPQFSARVAAQGVRSMLTFRLPVPGGNLGALSLYSTAPAAFDTRAENLGLLYATHAAVALFGAEQEAGLRLAVDSRDVIGQAKGILMERYNLTGEQAFGLLVRSSKQSNIKLRDIAERLAATGEFHLD